MRNYDSTIKACDICQTTHATCEHACCVTEDQHLAAVMRELTSNTSEHKAAALVNAGYGSDEMGDWYQRGADLIRRLEVRTGIRLGYRDLERAVKIIETEPRCVA